MCVGLCTMPMSGLAADAVYENDAVMDWLQCSPTIAPAGKEPGFGPKNSNNANCRAKQLEAAWQRYGTAPSHVLGRDFPQQPSLNTRKSTLSASAVSARRGSGAAEAAGSWHLSASCISGALKEAGLHCGVWGFEMCPQTVPGKQRSHSRYSMSVTVCKAKNSKRLFAPRLRKAKVRRTRVRVYITQFWTILSYRNRCRRRAFIPTATATRSGIIGSMMEDLWLLGRSLTSAMLPKLKGPRPRAWTLVSGWKGCVRPIASSEASPLLHVEMRDEFRTKVYKIYACAS